MQNNRPDILFTRKAEDEVRALAESQGLEPHFLPFIETEAIITAENSSKLAVLATETASVIFTSANAVRYAKTLVADASPEWQVHCIGRVTAMEVERNFNRSKIGLKANNAADLADQILRNTDNQLFYFVCGKQRRDELPEKLRAGNRMLEEIIVYETKLTPQKINRGYDAIVFMSPTAVESFFSANEDDSAIYFCIGKTTAETVQRFSGNKVITSPGPDQETLIETIADYYKKVH